MRIEQKSKNTLEKVSLMSSNNFLITREFFEALITLIILDYLENKSTIIPFLGEIKIKYEGEKINKKEKQVKIKINIDPSEILLHNIKQIKDDNECDIIKLYSNKIRSSIEKKLLD